MADPEVKIVQLLSQQGVKVYPDKVPANGTYPCAVYQRISTPMIRSHTGNELQTPRIQITTHATSRKAANTLAAAIKSILDLNQTDFKLAYKEGELDMNDDETGLYSRVLDFIVITTP